MSTTLIATASLARLLEPLIKDLYQGAKKLGVNGLAKWEIKKSTDKIGKRIKAIEVVRTLWKQDGPISLLDFFHQPKLIINEKPTIISRVTELPSNFIVIEGIIGQGKSIFMRSLASEEIRSNNAKRLPIFIELKNLNAKMDLRLAIHKQLESYDIEVDEDTLNYLYRVGKVVLLLDGFDEVEENIIKQTYLDIESLTLKYPELQIVVSSRPGHEIQKSSQFQSLKIANLAQSEYSAFLTKLKISSERSLSLREAIKNSPSNISSLIKTPLMLTMVVMVYETESQIPETLPEFFEKLFSFIFTRHDSLKAAFTRRHFSGLSERRLRTLFESFSFMTLQFGYGRTLTQVQFDEVFDQALDYAEDCKCTSDNFKKDIIKVACLMLDDGIDTYTFLHKSILEYFAAAFVKRLGEENAILFYSSIVEKSRGWEDVLIFLKAIDGVRYSRHYLIPIINKHRTEIIDPANSENDSSFILQISKLYPGIGVYFKLDPKDKTRVQVTGFGSLDSRPGDEVGNFAFLLLDALNNIIPSTLTTEELIMNFHADPTNSTHYLGIHVSTTPLLREYGTSELKKAVGILESRLDRFAEEGRTIIAQEEKKKLIFQPRALTL